MDWYRGGRVVWGGGLCRSGRVVSGCQGAGVVGWYGRVGVLGWSTGTGVVWWYGRGGL